LCPIYRTANKIKLTYATKKSLVFHGLWQELARLPSHWKLGTTYMKLVKPWVKIMMMLKMTPYQLNQGCNGARYGSELRGVPRARRARIKQICEIPIQAQAMNPATAEIFRSLGSVSAQTTSWLGGLTIQRLDLRCSTHS
jgi:hypothetical protein